MQYKPLSHIEIIGRTNILTNRIIVKALQSNRGYKIRAMNDAALKMMVESVFNAVCNKLTVEAQRVYECTCDPTAGFKLISDVEIEKEVTAFFESNGKLQYREVKFESFIDLPGVDKSVNWLTQQMKMGELGMLYNPYSLADRLEKAGILTDIEIMTALLDERGDVIREMSHADLKQLWKGVFSLSYQELYAEAADGFEPKTEFEIDQEIKAYFEEQGMLQ